MYWVGGARFRGDYDDEIDLSDLFDEKDIEDMKQAAEESESEMDRLGITEADFR